MDAGSDNYWSPPGGDDFRDVTSLLVAASAELKDGDMIFMDQFTLHDAMSVLEIGEPRLDSGLLTHEPQKPPFNPLEPLLPEEVAWIIDRSMAMEVEYLAGNFLAHTVYTLLYVHHVADMEVDLVSSDAPQDPSRPIHLVTTVLRSAVQGMLKCCDLTWRELARGSTYDTEDWQSDKSEVSLLEAIPTTYILAHLDEAITWLERSNIAPNWKYALQTRLLFRKTLIEALSTSPKNKDDLLRRLTAAKSALFVMQAFPSPSSVGPTVQAVFDPHIGRQLQMSTPIRVIEPPSIEDTHKALSSFLDGLEQVAHLAGCTKLATWKVAGQLQAWSSGATFDAPFVRSLIQSTLYDGTFILHRYSFEWMIANFFLDALGVDYVWLQNAIKGAWSGSAPPSFRDIERSLYVLFLPSIKTLWHSGPRRRRLFMRSILEWQALYNHFEDLLENVDFDKLAEDSPVRMLASAALIPRFSIIREIVLSGFKMEIYSPQERCFAYFYAAEVCAAQIGELENIVLVTSINSPVYRDAIFQIQFLTALRGICSALFLVCIPLACFDWDKIRATFFRRYKWAFYKEFDRLSRPPIANPDIHAFSIACDERLSKERSLPAQYITDAKQLLQELSQAPHLSPWAGLWEGQQRQFLKGLVKVCDNLESLPSTIEELDVFDTRKLKWDPSVHPWFPSLSPPLSGS